MDLRSSYAQSLVELDSLTRVNMNDPNSIKESKKISIQQIIDYFKLKEIKYYKEQDQYNYYYYDENTKYVWHIMINTDPLKMPEFKKLMTYSSPSGYDKYVAIMEFNGYKDNILTLQEFNKQQNTLVYSDNNIFDIASGFNKTNKEYDYETFVPQLEMPNYNAEMPSCCIRQFIVSDSKTNSNICLSCKSEFKTVITYNCPFCNNKQSSISVNGDGVYCLNCNEDMDYGRSFNITKDVKCVKKCSNTSFDTNIINEISNMEVSDEFNNKLNPPSYSGF
jgi:hypothetical protein